MVIGIWSGESKPNLSEYIELLVAELESILLNGIFIRDHHVKINFGCVLCDTPARSLMKGTIVEHNDAVYIYRMYKYN